MTAQNTITKKINLVIQRDSSNVITCYSQLNNAVATAKSQICSDLGGTINAAGHCDITAKNIAKKAACTSLSGTYSAGVCTLNIASAACNAITGASFASGVCTLPAPAAAAAPAAWTIVEFAQLTCPTGTTLSSKFWTGLREMKYSMLKTTAGGWNLNPRYSMALGKYETVWTKVKCVY